MYDIDCQFGAKVHCISHQHWCVGFHGKISGVSRHLNGTVQYFYVEDFKGRLIPAYTGQNIIFEWHSLSHWNLLPGVATLPSIPAAAPVTQRSHQSQPIAQSPWANAAAAIGNKETSKEIVMCKHCEIALVECKWHGSGTR